MKNKILSVATAAYLLATLTTPTYAGTETGNSSFYDRKSEGWFWYEPEPEKIEPEEPEYNEPAVPAPPSEPGPESESSSKEVVVNVKWLRENLPILRDAAIDEPTYDNVRRYFYAQRIMMDKASKFASVSQEVSKFETPLDESLRRPENQMALYDFKVDAKQNRNSVVEGLANEVGLFFFYSSTCSYCVKQASIIERLARETGLDVLAVSLDGRPLPGGEFPDYVTDPGNLSQKLQITVTPTTYLVKKDGSEFHNLAAGLTSADEILRRSVLLAKSKGWISEEEYNTTKEVKEILLTDDTKEKLMVDTDKVLSDPNYLADKLRKKFQSQYKTNSNISEYEGTNQ